MFVFKFHSISMKSVPMDFWP